MAEFFSAIGHFFAITWWFWVFVILFPIFYSTWLAWREELFKHLTRYALLELKIFREVKEDPKAMEQVLEAIYSLRNVASDIREIFWDGEVAREFSLEIVSFGGEIRFFIRVPTSWRDFPDDNLVDLVKAAFFSYYPDLEIEEVEDYIKDLPQTMEEMYEKGYEMWGSEMLLAKSPIFPIKWHTEFESLDKEEPYDTMSAFIEVLGRARRGETVMMQIIIAFVGDEWKEKHRDEVRKLKRKAENLDQPSEKAASSEIEFPGGILPAFSTEGETSGPQKLRPTRREEAVLRSVQENLAETCFNTVIRYAAISPKEIFYEAFGRRGVGGIFNQFSASDMNAIEKNHKTSSRTRLWLPPFIFPNLRAEHRNQRLLHKLIHRETPSYRFMGEVITSHLFGWNFWSERFPMSVVSLATLFHPPMKRVLTAPRVKRVESRRAAPQISLPVFGEEKEIEKYK